jgi:hypothetical protein
MITVIWGSSKHRFNDIEELMEAYPRLNNRPKYLSPKKSHINYDDLLMILNQNSSLNDEVERRKKMLKMDFSTMFSGFKHNPFTIKQIGDHEQLK